jgi:hypothetical protein
MYYTLDNLAVTPSQCQVDSGFRGNVQIIFDLIKPRCVLHFSLMIEELELSFQKKSLIWVKGKKW